MKLPSGVKHVDGMAYRVKLTAVQIVDGGFADSKGFEFRNPRWQTVRGKATGRGFTQEEMEELREEIRLHGLNHPLRCRWFPYSEAQDSAQAVQLVDGERRFRCLSYLISHNIPCKDPVTGKMVPAQELYATIPCNISWMTDTEALQIALQGNETSVRIGPGAYIGLVRYLQDCGKTDEQVLELCCKSPDWLCKTKHLLELDEASLTALCEDRINRRVAQMLLKEPDAESRATLLTKALAATDARIAQLEANMTEADLEFELAQAESKFGQKRGLKTIVQSAEGKLAKATQKVRKAKQAIARPRANISSAKDVEASGEVVVKSLTPAKLEKLIYQPVCDLIKSKALDMRGEPLALDLDDAKLVKAFVDMMRDGVTGDPETMCVRFLITHKKNKEKRLVGAS